jgi:plastocyanin
MAKTSLIIGVVVVIIVIVIAGVLAYMFLYKPAGSGGNFNGSDIYAAEYGFGADANSKSSPGPTMTFTAGQSVTITLHNVGAMTHNWAIVDAKSSTANVLWNAQIGTASTPIAAGGTGSVTFTVGAAGSYYYICQVDGHVALGMWGVVKVNP